MSTRPEHSAPPEIVSSKLAIIYSTINLDLNLIFIDSKSFTMRRKLLNTPRIVE